MRQNQAASRAAIIFPASVPSVLGEISGIGEPPSIASSSSYVAFSNEKSARAMCELYEYSRKAAAKAQIIRLETVIGIRGMNESLMKCRQAISGLETERMNVRLLDEARKPSPVPASPRARSWPKSSPLNKLSGICRRCARYQN